MQIPPSTPASLPRPAELRTYHGSFYVVRAGFTEGLFSSWADASISVTGYSCNCYQKLTSWEEAMQFYVNGPPPRRTRSQY